MPERCQREGATPDGDRLIVDCTVHGEVGSVPAGDDEFKEIEQLFAAHVADDSTRLSASGPTVEQVQQAYADLDWYGPQITDPDAQYNPAALAIVSAARVLRAACDRRADERGALTHAASVRRTRAAAAEAALERVLDECDLGEFQATRWADPYPVPAWVEDVRRAVAGEPPSLRSLRPGRDMRPEVWDEIKSRRPVRPAQPRHEE